MITIPQNRKKNVGMVIERGPFDIPYRGPPGVACNNLTSCMYVTSLVYISMPLILKINIVITTQRACPILEYYIALRY